MSVRSRPRPRPWGRCWTTWAGRPTGSGPRRRGHRCGSGARGWRAGVGATGGHGPIRYSLTAYEPGRRASFAFAPGGRLDGTHTFTVEPLGSDRCRVRHVLEGRLRGDGVLVWPLAVRWLHDALLEDLLDRVEHETGSGPACPARWSPWVQVLSRAFAAPQAVPVPRTALLADALPRVDAADAFAVPAPPGSPTDPQTWADAVFRSPPGWVAALMALRQALVGLVGIERGDRSAFDTLRATDDEVLLGTDAGHLDFRASVLRAEERVVLSTVVRLRNRRGRLYWGVVRHVHPIVVRAMLGRAARRMAALSPTGDRC